MEIPNIDDVQVEYPASEWSIKNSEIVKSIIDHVDQLTDPEERALFLKNGYDAFRKKYGLGLIKDQKSLNILMIAADLAGCGYARIERPARYMNRTSQAIVFPTTRVTRELIHWAQVIVWQRQYKDEMYSLFKIAKRLHKVQIFDIDDNIHAVSRTNPAYQVYNAKKKAYYDMLRWMKRCDLVTVTNKALGEYYRDLAGIEYAVLPNCIDFEEFPAVDWSRRTGDTVRIGWAGSVSHHPDLRIVSGVLKDLKKAYGGRVEMVIMGWNGIQRVIQKIDPDGPDDESNRRIIDKEVVLQGMQREFHPFVATENYCKALCDLNLDIAVVPLARSKFNLSGKSNLKYLEMSAAKIPCVLSKNTVYDEVTHGENGFLAGNDKEWRLYLDRLIQDRGLRRRIAENAYDYVKANYNFADQAYRWTKTYLTILMARHLEKVQKRVDALKT